MRGLLPVEPEVVGRTDEASTEVMLPGGDSGRRGVSGLRVGDPIGQLEPTLRGLGLSRRRAERLVQPWDHRQGAGGDDGAGAAGAPPSWSKWSGGGGVGHVGPAEDVVA